MAKSSRTTSHHSHQPTVCLVTRIGNTTQYEFRTLQFGWEWLNGTNELPCYRYSWFYFVAVATSACKVEGLLQKALQSAFIFTILKTLITNLNCLSSATTQGILALVHNRTSHDTLVLLVKLWHNRTWKWIYYKATYKSFLTDGILLTVHFY